MATSSDLNLSQFTINTISKANYDQLSAAGQIQQNELYLVADAPIDANGAKISNVAAPELSSDAATKGYVDEVTNSLRLNYKLPSEESTYMQDRTVNQLTMNGDLSVYFPAQKPGIARDFLLNLNYTAGQMTIMTEIEKCGDELSFATGKQHLITFAEIGSKNDLPLFYIRVIELS